MGTGTETGIICKKLDREFIGIELDGNAYDISKDRIENYVIQMSIILKQNKDADGKYKRKY